MLFHIFYRDILEIRGFDQIGGILKQPYFTPSDHDKKSRADKLLRLGESSCINGVTFE